MLGLWAASLESNICDLRAAIHTEARAFTRTWGRGFFQMFLATLGLINIQTDECVFCWVGGQDACLPGLSFLSLSLTPPPPLSPNHRLFLIISAIVLFVVGGVNVFVGICTSLKTTSLSLSVERAQEVFDEHDKNHNGFLETIELQSCLASLGVDLNAVELEAAVTEMDIDGDGKINKREFTLWAQGAIADAIDSSALREESDLLLNAPLASNADYGSA